MDLDVEAMATDTTRERPASQARQYIELGWEKVDHPNKEELLLLYTRGRRSGAMRRTPLVYHFADEDSLVLVGNNGGRDYHPDWYHNLTADPAVWIRNRDNFYQANAVSIDDDEHPQIWSRLVEKLPHLAESQAKVDRTIPLVRVTRIST